MYNQPRLKIEIEGLKQSVVQIFNQNNQELSDMVTKTIEDRLKSEWVQDQINLAVEQCIREAISNVSNNYELQRALTNLISASVAELISE